MANYSFFVLFSILLATVSPFNLQTRVVNGTSELLEPFTKVGENHYFIESTNTTTWHGAAHCCRAKNAHLACIQSEHEMDLLSTYLTSQGYNKANTYWIAGNDIDEPHKFFCISNGKPMPYTKWSVDNPNNANDNERCVHLWLIGNEFLMNDLRCNKQAHYICKTNDPKTVSITVW